MLVNVSICLKLYQSYTIWSWDFSKRILSKKMIFTINTCIWIKSIKVLCFPVFSIYNVHDEVKDKSFELELSWVGAGMYRTVMCDIMKSIIEITEMWKWRVCWCKQVLGWQSAETLVELHQVDSEYTFYFINTFTTQSLHSCFLHIYAILRYFKVLFSLSHFQCSRTLFLVIKLFIMYIWTGHAVLIKSFF